jgi:hypothetical protein
MVRRVLGSRQMPIRLYLLCFLILTSFLKGSGLGEYAANLLRCQQMDEGRKRVLGIMTAIPPACTGERPDVLFGGPQGSPRSDKLIAASVQWAEAIMRKIDGRLGE